MDLTTSEFNVQTSHTLNVEPFLSNWKLVHADESEIAYFLFLEKVCPVDMKFKYFLISKKTADGKEIPCARLYAQLINFTDKNITLSNRFLSLLTKLFFKTHPFKLFIYGNAFAVNSSPVDYLPELIQPNQLGKMMFDLAKTISHDVLILKDIPGEFDQEQFLKMDLERYTADLTMTMHLRKKWKSLDDYKADLTKKYRKRAEKILEAGMSLRKKLITPDLYPLYRKRIGELLNQVASKQMVRIGMVTEKYIEQYLHQFPETFQIHGIFKDEELIAFYTSIDRQRMLEIHYIGMDYRYNEEYALYFNMLFFSLQQAIEEGKSSLELGRTAREAKASLGSTAEYFNDFIRINNPLARFLSKKLTGIFQNEMGERWKERRPLKPE